MPNVASEWDAPKAAHPQLFSTPQKRAGQETKITVKLLVCSVFAWFALFTPIAIGQVAFDPDVDGNGVRDDVEAYVKEKYPGNTALVRLFQDYIRVFQQFVGSYDNPEKSKEVMRAMIALHLCLDRIQEGAAELVSSEIKPRVLDTYEASIAYMDATDNIPPDFASPSDKAVKNVCSKYVER